MCGLETTGQTLMKLWLHTLINMKLSDLSGEKQSDSEFLSYNLMLNSGQKK
jgi:hypothetical protein